MKATRILAFLLLAGTAGAQQPQQEPSQQAEYDLLLRGGHVIDPRNGIDAVRDLAIRGGKVAAE